MNKGLDFRCLDQFIFKADKQPLLEAGGVSLSCFLPGWCTYAPAAVNVSH